ncbi:MAG: SpoIIE family protein phosphatase [Bdellovibrionaceae bacterium]|jgi:phosphoserine phosphatase RsbU/P|nr:SpoIIE family protein phosphatase [Pseudobdellovibrionaceae bacterium]
MGAKIQISLRYKLLVLLAALPISFLAIYLVMAINLFYEDKKAYIFDSSVFNARALSSQVKLELSSYNKIAKPILESINYANLKLSSRSKSFFNAQTSIEHLIIYKKAARSEFYSITDHLMTSGREVISPKLDPNGLITMQKIAVSKGIIISDYKVKTRFFLIMQSHNPVKSANHFISLSIYRSPEIFEAFATPTMFKSYLISKSRFFSMKPKFIRTHGDKIKIEAFNFFNPILNQLVPEGTAEVNTKDGHPALISFSNVGVGDLMVASVVDKAAAFAAVDSLVFKSLLFFIAIVCIAFLISVVLSRGLTDTIGELLKATEKISKGDFKIELDVSSRDEFGELGRRFVAMAQEVSNLLKTTADQARMENELEMVRVVQENLFPEQTMEIGPLKIVSHFEPASECGGDWFHYCIIDEKIYLWIGDVTGHGASAALITGAARSAAAIIEASSGMSPSDALEVMNHALNSTAHGSILMTFFLAAIDPNTGSVQYANASHEFPYVIPAKKGLKKKDLVPLCDVALGKRLGEAPGSTYKEGTYQLQEGDSIFFFTDGIIDLQNSEGKEFGERSMIKAILESAQKSPHIAGKVDKYKKTLDSYRENTPLVDDITLFWVQYK